MELHFARTSSPSYIVVEFIDSSSVRMTFQPSLLVNGLQWTVNLTYHCRISPIGSTDFSPMPSGQFQCPAFAVVFSAKWTRYDISPELGESYVPLLNKLLIYVYSVKRTPYVSSL